MRLKTPVSRGRLAPPVTTTTEGHELDRLETLDHVRHELARPVTAIRACAELLDDGLCGALSAEQAHQVRRILRGAATMMREIDRLHACLAGALGRVETEPAILSVGPVCDEAARAARERHGLQEDALHVPVGPRVLAVADKALLAATLRELLDNAVLYGGGSRVELAFAACGEHCRITITDAGPGLAQEEAEAVFEPFRRGAAAADVCAKGMGLGLPLASGWAAAMGGGLTLVERAEGGCGFVLTLPLATSTKERERGRP